MFLWGKPVATALQMHVCVMWAERREEVARLWTSRQHCVDNIIQTTCTRCTRTLHNVVWWSVAPCGPLSMHSTSNQMQCVNWLNGRQLIQSLNVKHCSCRIWCYSLISCITAYSRKYFDMTCRHCWCEAQQQRITLKLQLSRRQIYVSTFTVQFWSVIRFRVY